MSGQLLIFAGIGLRDLLLGRVFPTNISNDGQWPVSGAEVISPYRVTKCEICMGSGVSVTSRSVYTRLPGARKLLLADPELSRLLTCVCSLKLRPSVFKTFSQLLRHDRELFTKGKWFCMQSWREMVDISSWDAKLLLAQSENRGKYVGRKPGRLRF